MTSVPVEQHLQELTAFFSAQAPVVAVALSGSATGNWSDRRSDLDVYVYVTGEVSVEARTAFIHARASRAEINNTIWETGDEWDDARGGQHHDVMYRWVDFVGQESRRLLVEHQARTGYTTAVLANIAHSQVLYDPSGWLGRQLAVLRQPYPEELRRAVISKNWPLLRGAMGSYTNQLISAVERRDSLAVNHRLAAYFGSYTDILFALNRAYHPGEKRLMRHITALPLVPADFEARVRQVLDAPNGPEMTLQLEALSVGLEDLLTGQGLLG